MLDHGNAQLSAVGFYNPTMGQEPVGEFFGGASACGLVRPFNISGGKVCNCRISAPDAVLTCGDYAIDEDGGDIYVHVDRTDSSGGSSYALSVDQTSRNPSATHAQWTLYKYDDGEATLDCRPGVLPVFSLL